MEKTYVELAFRVQNPAESDLLIGWLSTLGFDGFREEDAYLYACMDEASFEPGVIMASLPDGIGQPDICRIKEENWNAQWESSFDPVVIPGRLSVRAMFHQPVLGVEREIVITPKMSFGTGHHATTSLMLEEMLDLPFRGKDVLDFGTGTGVLAILASMSGANRVLAIDNDPWSMENAAENVTVNECPHIDLSLTDQLPTNIKFDIILANINRNVILANRVQLCSLLHPDGILLLSGLLESDRSDVEKAFMPHFSQPPFCRARNGWIVLKYGYPNFA
jgi:ribosomal protein L11 methyltransferase